MLPVYRFITRYVEERLGLPTELYVGSSYEQLHTEADVAFVCGLPYVELTRQGESPVEPIAAPVIQGDRYGGRPIYFSDVVVHRDSHLRSFAELRGRSWSYNEPWSQSGYGITRYHLMQLGETGGYFAELIQAGWHEQSLRLVWSGKVDATAIDSQVLAIALRDHPELAVQLRIIDCLGPSTTPPVVAARRLPIQLRDDLRAVLVAMHEDPQARDQFRHGFVERFMAVDATNYDDIRAMLEAVQEADFLVLR
jgi:phosphonate transport system substrate-binding protein